MRIAALLCAILLASFTVSPALHAAQDPLAGKKLDLDGDGKIERDELRAALEAELSSLDKDHDGKFDRKEAHQVLKRLKDKLDADKEGKIEQEELRSELRKLKEHHPLLYERVAFRIGAHRAAKAKK